MAIVSVGILIIGLAILGYYLQQGRKGLLTDPYKAISPDACLIIETVDLQNFINSLTTGKGLFGEIGKVKELERFTYKLKYLTDQINKPGYKRLLNDRKAIISFIPSSDGNLKTLLSVNVPGEIRLRHIKEILRSSGITKVIENKSAGNSMLKIPYEENNVNDTLCISLVSGLMICCSSEELINKAKVNMMSGTDVRSRPGFTRVLTASGRNEDKIFVVFANLPKLVNKFFLPGKKDLAENVSRLAGTAGGDIYISENGVVLSGYTESPDPTEFLYKYKFLQPRELHTYRILPSAVVFFETQVLPVESMRIESKDSVSPESITLAGKLKEFTGDEITRACIEPKGRTEPDNTLIIIELKDRVRAEQILLENLGTRSDISYFQPDDQIKMPVYRIPFRGLISVLIPGFVQEFSETYIAFYDNFMIAGSSFATVSRLLYDNLLNKTLANDITYHDFEGTLPSRAGYFFYCVPSRFINWLEGYLNIDIINALRSNKSLINKIQSAGYQFASSNGMIYNSLSIRYKEEAREESTTEWETLLDTVAGIKPFFFTNHTTGAKEIFIQDLNNNTYLINSAGRVLWKVPLNERITGNIYMIDYFHNGKYQLLFSGKNYIHILDRNGNYVGRYPVKLRSAATSQLTMFDYDNNMNYRLFIAGEDKMIYSYDKTGSVVKGWKPFRTNGRVTADICYFKVSGKDYLVASDENSVYFLDRTGNKRVSLKEAVTRAKGSAMRLIPGSEPSIVCSSPDGTVQQIYTDGTVRKFSLKIFSVDHSFDFFDIDGDGFGEYIFIDKGILYLYNHNRSELFSRDFGSGDLGGPINFIFSASDRKIGVFDVNKKQIYMIDKDGKTVDGFPLRGASMFSIGKLSDKNGWHLIVGGTDRFLYNYKIETEIK